MSTKLTRRQLITRGLAATVGLSALDAFGIEPRWLSHEVTEIPIKGLGKELDGYRISLLSDFHVPRASKGLVQSAVKMAMDFKPDIILMPGDFVHGKWHKDNNTGPVPDLSGYFNGAHAPDGVFGTLGNHDHWLNADGVREQLKKNTPIKLIENEHVIVRRGTAAIAFGGVGDLWEGHLRPDLAFSGVDKATPRILLSHNPDYAE